MASENEVPSVGHIFVHYYYYPILNEHRDFAYQFYGDSSLLTWPDAYGNVKEVTTRQGIDQFFLSCGNRDFEPVTFVEQCSPDGATVLLVIGWLTDKDNRKRKFAQSFYLSPPHDTVYAKNSRVLLHDIMRYLDFDNTANNEDDDVGDSGQVNPVPEQISAASVSASGFTPALEAHRAKPTEESDRTVAEGTSDIVDGRGKLYDKKGSYMEPQHCETESEAVAKVGSGMVDTLASEAPVSNSETSLKEEKSTAEETSDIMIGRIKLYIRQGSLMESQPHGKKSIVPAISGSASDDACAPKAPVSDRKMSREVERSVAVRADDVVEIRKTGSQHVPRKQSAKESAGGPGNVKAHGKESHGEPHSHLFVTEASAVSLLASEVTPVLEAPVSDREKSIEEDEKAVDERTSDSVEGHIKAYDERGSLMKPQPDVKESGVFAISGSASEDPPELKVPMSHGETSVGEEESIPQKTTGILEPPSNRETPMEEKSVEETDGIVECDRAKFNVEPHLHAKEKIVPVVSDSASTSSRKDAPRSRYACIVKLTKGTRPIRYYSPTHKTKTTHEKTEDQPVVSKETAPITESAGDTAYKQIEDQPAVSRETAPRSQTI